MRYSIYVVLLLAAVFLVTFPLSAADERSIRVFGNDKYEILEARGLYIYSLDVLVRKGTSEKKYFFSVGPAREIVPLTILNLKKALPDNGRRQINDRDLA